MACMLYESILLIAILALATFIFLKIFGVATQSPLRYFLQFYLWLIAGAYFIFCWVKSGQTLAMQTWRIQLLGHMQSKWLEWRETILWNHPAPLRVISLVIIRNTGIHGSN